MDKKTKNLIRHALRVRKNSYSPYSKYSVGAALLTKTGKIFTGCNVENVAYGESICAEKSAVVKAVSEGYKNFTTIVVATRNGASHAAHVDKSSRSLIQKFR